MQKMTHSAFVIQQASHTDFAYHIRIWVKMIFYCMQVALQVSPLLTTHHCELVSQQPSSQS